MDVNIKTIALLVIITHLLQIVVFINQYRVNKSFKGLGWWVIWSISVTAGILIFVLRSMVAMPLVFILMQNLLIIGGIICVYIGIMRFLGKKENIRVIITTSTIFVLLLLYFLIFDNIKIRSGIINTAIAFWAFFTAVNFYIHKFKSISAIADFIILTFIAHGLVFTYLALEAFFVVENFLLYMPKYLSALQLFDALIIGLLWTFGLIMMVNQRLNTEMREAKEHFEQIFNTSPDAVSITSIKNGEYLDINENFTRITGFTREDTIGKSSLDVKIWKDVNDREEVVRRLKETGICTNYEAQFVRKDGVVITGLMSATITKINGKKYIVSISREITEWKIAERKINEQNEELKKLIAEKDKFFSIIAHDLRSPFNGFLGLTELMVTEIDNMSMNEINQVSNQLNVSANHLYSMLTNLLEWASVQRGLVKFLPEELNLYEIISFNEKLFKESFAQKGISMETDVPEEISISADKVMFHIIIENLISNALKFTNKGGKVNVAAQDNAESILISVKDTGIGMSDEQINDLFRIDKKTYRAGTDNEPSTGLGLLLCKEFVEKHNGKIWVLSEEGKGTEFLFALPKTDI